MPSKRRLEGSGVHKYVVTDIWEYALLSDPSKTVVAPSSTGSRTLVSVERSSDHTDARALSLSSGRWSGSACACWFPAAVIFRASRRLVGSVSEGEEVGCGGGDVVASSLYGREDDDVLPELTPCGDPAASSFGVSGS